MTERYERALRLAKEKHRGQFRAEGIPYITHPVAVAELLADWGYDEDTRIAGLFHDLLEDTDATEAEIEAIGGEAVLRAVKLVTKEPGYEMQDYVSRILAHPMAKAVKTADRLHNLRSAHVCTDKFKARYIRESALWYAGLHPEIPIAIRALAGSVGEARLREELGKELELML